MDDWQKKYIENRLAGLGPMPQLQQQHSGIPKNFPQPHQQTGRQSIACTIRPGALTYKAIDAGGFGSTEVMVIQNGVLSEEYAGRQFVVDSRTPTSCLLLESQTQLVDLGNKNKKTLIKLIKVTIPFLGSFFVQESNIQFVNNSLNNSPRGGGLDNKSVLKG